MPAPLPVNGLKSAVGIDVGLEKLLTTSDGQAVEAPQCFRKAQAQPARQQRRLARKKRGSQNYQRQANRVARLQLHMARQGKDFHYRVAHRLCRVYDLMAFEPLDIKGLARTRLAKSVLDAAWGEFVRILAAVAVERGKWAVGDDARGTSIECSG